MMHIYAAMARKELELISERTRAAKAAAKARSARLGGDRGDRPAAGPDSGAATLTRRVAAERAAHRLWLEVDQLRKEGVTSRQALARALTKRGVPTPQDGKIWTHTTVWRLLARTAVGMRPRRSRIHGPASA
jgi:DNA invertase Pin-like site-specific DNA recombinase